MKKKKDSYYSSNEHLFHLAKVSVIMRAGLVANALTENKETVIKQMAALRAEVDCLESHALKKFPK